MLENTDISISTNGLNFGTFYAYAVDASGNISSKGTNAISINDGVLPIVTANTQSVSNIALQTAKVQSDKIGNCLYYSRRRTSIKSSSNILTIDIENNFYGNCVAEIYNLLGRKIANYNLASNHNEFSIEFSGVILVRINNGNKIVTKKIFIQ